MTKPLSKMHQRVVLSPEERAAMDHESERQKAVEIINANQVPPNSYWDDANRAFSEVNQNIDHANHLLAERVQAAMETPERRALIKDEMAVAANLNLVMKDILSCRHQLDVVSKRHAGKTGGAKTAEELIEVMEINDLYRSALTMYNSNVLPVVTHILELLSEDAETSEQALQQQAVMADRLESIVIDHDAATDPTVVTDVVVKEPSLKNNES